MDMLVRLSKELRNAQHAGLVRVFSSPSVYNMAPNNQVTVTTIQFVNPPTEVQLTNLYAYIKGQYSNILLDLRTFPDPNQPRLEMLTKDDPLTTSYSTY